MKGLFHITNTAIYLDIKAIPGASRTELAGIKDGRLRVRVAAAPEKGRANAALCEFIAGILGCPKRELYIISGEKGRNKTLSIPLAYKAKVTDVLGR
ncbi:MAG: DUF167 domain-containing protein [Treponema sp.]|jgi:uncharacterized protein (TIGR00251 family)|nr:DUF167 domain-containing protein [Treponema sp.]